MSCISVRRCGPIRVDIPDVSMAVLCRGRGQRQTAMVKLQHPARRLQTMWRRRRRKKRRGPNWRRRSQKVRGQSLKQRWVLKGAKSRFLLQSLAPTLHVSHMYIYPKKKSLPVTRLAFCVNSSAGRHVSGNHKYNLQNALTNPETWHIIYLESRMSRLDRAGQSSRSDLLNTFFVVT